MSWQPRCRRCHRVLTDSDSIKRGYGAHCFKQTFGFRPRKRRLSILRLKGYVRADEIPPLFLADPHFIESEEVGQMGTITVVNRSTVTDKAALALASDYYNDKDNVELQAFLERMNIKIVKKGHKFTILDVEEEVKTDG